MNYRIIIFGTSGAGKSTLARKISQKLGTPHIELDNLRFGPNWSNTPKEEYHAHIKEAIKQENWVIDGNVFNSSREIVWPRATHLLWLRYSLHRTLWQLFKRTIHARITGTEIVKGNKESLRINFLSRQSLFLLAYKKYFEHRKHLPEALGLPENKHLQVTIFTNPSQANQWLEQLPLQSQE